MGALADAVCGPDPRGFAADSRLARLVRPAARSTLRGHFGWTTGSPGSRASGGRGVAGFAATEAAQIRCWSVSREQLKAAAPLGDLPLAVLAVSEQPVGGELLTALQRELAELTEDASFEVVQGASHESVISNREHARVVAKTIQAVVQAAADRSLKS